MIHEYALEPELVASWHDRIRGRIFIDKFGPDTGRLVSRYPNKTKWADLLRKAFEETFGGTPGEKETARGRIEELRKQFMSPPAVKRSECVWDANRGWLVNAESEHTRKPFHAILARDNPHANVKIIVENDVIDRKATRWDTPITVTVKRAAEEMAKCVTPMLRCATKILFVDPNFRANKKEFREPLAAFLRSVDTQTSKITIELHTEERDDTPSWTEFRKECENKLPPIIPKGLTLTVYRWKEREGGEKLHNRYILTDIGGVSFLTGLDEGDPGMTDDVSRLSAATYNQRWNDYDERNGVFKLDRETFSVEGQAIG